MSDKIKPCPFCGETKRFGIGRRADEYGENILTFIFCTICKCKGPAVITHDASAWTCTAYSCEVTGWNRRANER